MLAAIERSHAFRILRCVSHAVDRSKAPNRRNILKNVSLASLHNSTRLNPYPGTHEIVSFPSSSKGQTISECDILNRRHITGQMMPEGGFDPEL